MTTQERFEEMAKRIQDFTEIELPELIEAKAIKAMEDRLRGTPLEPLGSLLIRDAEIFPPDGTGLVYARTAIGAIEAARELFIANFATDQLTFAMATFAPGPYAVQTVIQTAKAIYQAAKKTSLSTVLEGIWSYVLHIGISLTATLYGPRAVKFSLELAEVIFALRGNRLFQSRAQREWIQKRSRD